MVFNNDNYNTWFDPAVPLIIQSFCVCNYPIVLTLVKSASHCLDCTQTGVRLHVSTLEQVVQRDQKKYIGSYSAADKLG